MSIASEVKMREMLQQLAAMAEALEKLRARVEALEARQTLRLDRGKTQ